MLVEQLVIPEFKKLRHEHCKFETGLGYQGRPCLKKKIIKADNRKFGRAGARCLLWATHWLQGTMGVTHTSAKPVCESLPVLPSRKMAFLQVTGLPGTLELMEAYSSHSSSVVTQNVGHILARKYTNLRSEEDNPDSNWLDSIGHVSSLKRINIQRVVMS